MKLRALCVILASALVTTGCETETEPQCELAPPDTLVSLIDHGLWTVAPLETDPWAEFRPEVIECPEASRKHEDFAGIDSFGVETKSCAYTTVVQPLKTAICGGEQLYIWIWRFALTGPADATSHIAVQIGDDVIWAVAIPIPAPSALVAIPVPLPGPYPAGTPIYFHVRNHGDNAYQLLDLARCVGTCAPQ